MQQMTPGFTLGTPTAGAGRRKQQQAQRDAELSAPSGYAPALLPSPGIAPPIFAPRVTGGSGARREQQHNAQMMAEFPAPGMSANTPNALRSAPSLSGSRPASFPIGLSYPGMLNTSSPAPTLSAPSSPSQTASMLPYPYSHAPAISNAATAARSNANRVLSAPLPTPGPAPTGGSASFTDEHGRTTTREFLMPGMFTQSTTGGAPNAPMLSPALSAPSGPSFSGYTPGDVTRIGNDRQNHAADQNARADKLDDSLTYPGASADGRAREESRQLAMSRGKAETDAIAAAAESTRAGTAATQRQNVDLQKRHKEVSDQLTKLTAERDKLQEQIGKASPTTKPSDTIAASREQRLAGEAWMKIYSQFRADPEFQAMPVKERVALAKEMAGMDAENGGGAGAGAGGAASASGNRSGPNSPATQESEALTGEAHQYAISQGYQPNTDGSYRGPNGKSYRLRMEGDHLKGDPIR